MNFRVEKDRWNNLGFRYYFYGYFHVFKKNRISREIFTKIRAGLPMTRRTAESEFLTVFPLPDELLHASFIILSVLLEIVSILIFSSPADFIVLLHRLIVASLNARQIFQFHLAICYFDILEKTWLTICCSECIILTNDNSFLTEHKLSFAIPR